MLSRSNSQGCGPSGSGSGPARTLIDGTRLNDNHWWYLA
jgi:hypothetical protein